MIKVRHEVRVRSSVGRCFDLARSVDLHVDSSQEIGARAVAGRTSGLSGAGDSTTWSARFLGLRFSMTTRLENFSPPAGFGDRQTRGLLRRFAHIYRFALAPDDGCLMSDELTVEAPFGPLGRLMERLYLSRKSAAWCRGVSNASGG